MLIPCVWQRDFRKRRKMLNASSNLAFSTYSIKASSCNLISATRLVNPHPSKQHADHVSRKHGSSASKIGPTCRPSGRKKERKRYRAWDLPKYFCAPAPAAESIMKYNALVQFKQSSSGTTGQNVSLLSIICKCKMRSSSTVPRAAINTRKSRMLLGGPSVAGARAASARCFRSNFSEPCQRSVFR